MGSYSGDFPGAAAGGAVIANIYTGTISGAVGESEITATITAVDLSKSIVYYNGSSASATSSACNSGRARIELTDSTTVTATREATIGVWMVGYTVVEYASGVSSVEQYTSTVGNGSTVVAITSVDVNKSIIVAQGISTSDNSVALIEAIPTLTSSTTVELRKDGAGTTGNVNFAVLEFE